MANYTILSKNVEKQVNALVAEGKDFDEAVTEVLNIQEYVEIPSEPEQEDSEQNVIEEVSDTSSSDMDGEDTILV